MLEGGPAHLTGDTMINLIILTLGALGILLALIALSLWTQDWLDARYAKAIDMTPLEKAILNHIAEQNDGR